MGKDHLKAKYVMKVQEKLECVWSYFKRVESFKNLGFTVIKNWELQLITKYKK